MHILHHYQRYSGVFGKPRLCGWSSGLLLVDCEDGALEDIPSC